MTGAPSTEPGPRGTTARLQLLLDAAGLRYIVDSSADAPVARFRLNVPPHVFVPYGLDLLPTVESVSAYAQLLGPVLRFSAFAAQPSSGAAQDLGTIDLVNAGWRAGWASAGADGEMCVHVPVYAESTVPARTTFDQALTALRDVASVLSSLPSDRAAIDRVDLPRILDAADGVFPEVPGGDRLDDVEGALRRLGITLVHTGPGQIGVALEEPDGHRLNVQFARPQGRFLEVRGRPAGPSGVSSPGTATALHTLNGRLHLGALSVQPGGVSYRASLPLAWLAAVDSELISWLIDHAAAALAAARRLDSEGERGPAAP